MYDGEDRYLIIMFKYIIKHNECMAFKTITIKERVYKELEKAKEKGESFSDFFERMIKEKKKSPDIMKFAGAWKDMPDEEFERIKKSMKEFRESANKSWEERLKRYKLK